MRKLILGIIAVICLDIAFIVYPGSDRPAQRAAVTINTTARQLNSIGAPVNDRSMAPQAEDVMAGPETADADRDDQRPAIVSRSLTAERSRTASSKRNDRMSDLDARLQPTVIVIGNSNSTARSLERRPDLSERAKKDMPDDRSFISSVLPIVKKPYEWIRFIGSKLR